MPEIRFNVPGRVALVTVGGGGIGRTIALGLAGIGINVGVEDKDPDRVAKTPEATSNCGVRGYGLVTDVGQHADVKRLVTEVSERLGFIDGFDVQRRYLSNHPKTFFHPSFAAS